MKKIRFDILTLFPDMFSNVMNESIIGRAINDGFVEINPVNIRDYTLDKHNRVDDYPYGGGAGMVMQAQPIYDAYKSVAKDDKSIPVIYIMSSKEYLARNKVFSKQILTNLGE